MFLGIFTPAYRVALCVVFALLSACGGGGGPGGPGGPAQDVVASDGGVGSTSGGDSGADGTAGDGAPIVGALVTLVDANGKSVTATTNFQGYYSAKISGFTSPIIGNVTKGSRTLYTFSTRAPAANQTVTINITGITDKIVSDVAALAGKDSARKITATDIVVNVAKIPGIISAVNTSIASILTANGLNPATFDPISMPFTTDHKGYDAVLDALLVTNGPSVPTRIAPLTPLEATQQLFKGLRDTAGAYSNTANTGELDTAGNKLEAAVNNATFIDSDTLRLVSKFDVASKMYEAFKAGTPFNNFTFIVGAIAFRTSLQSATNVFGRRTAIDVNGNAVPDSLIPEYLCYLGKVTTTTTSTGQTDVASFVTTNTVTSTTTAETNAFGCRGFALTGGLIGNALDGDRVHWHDIMFIPQPDGSYKYIHQTRCQFKDQRLGTASARWGEAKFGTVNRTKDAAGKLTAFSLNGEVTPGFQMLKVRTAAERDKFSHSAVNLNFNSVASGAAETATIGGSIKLVNVGGSTASDMQITPGSTLSAKTDIVRVIGGSCTPGTVSPTGVFVPGTCTNVTGTVSELSAMNLGVSVSMPNAKFEGTVAAGSASFDVTGADFTYQPNSVVLNGKIYEGDGAGGYRLLLDGKATAVNTNYSSVNTSVTETTSNFLRKKISFDGKILLKDRPEMSLTLAAQNSSPTASTMTGNFTWDGGWGFNFAMTKDNATNTGQVSFTSLSGVTFTLPRNSSTIKQPIYKNGVPMGYFTLSTKRIDYTDGSFEQF